MGSIVKDDRATGQRLAGGERARDLEVYVVFTDVAATLCALRTAAQLARGVAPRVRVLLAEAVPFPRAIDSPQRDLRFLARQVETLADRCSEGNAARPVETVAEILLCRDPFSALEEKLPSNSVVVIGKRNGWWPQREDRLAKRLRTAGHHVVRAATAIDARLPQFGWRAWANA